MQFFRSYYCLILFILSSIACPVFAGWTDDYRLTYRGNEILPQIITCNDTIHVIWNSSPDYVSYIRSTDGGETWDSLINISEEGHIPVDQIISHGENGLLVTWSDRDVLFRIGYSMSVDGTEWTEPEYLPTEHIDDFQFPTSAVSGDSIFISYWSLDEDSTGQEFISFFSSYDYGETWNDEVTVGYTYSTQQNVIITHCNNSLLIVRSGFVDSLHSGYHVVGYQSNDAGRTWSDLIWISPEQLYSAQSPCVACNEETGQLAVGYMDYRNQEYAFYGDVYIAISGDGGATWPREVRATQLPTAEFPSIDFIADTLLAVWSDRRYLEDSDLEILFNRSIDQGTTWGGELRLTDEDAFSTEPWVSVSDSLIHIVWRNWEEIDGQGYADIYYKKYIPDGTSITEDIKLFPEAISINAYPNPFNSALTLTTKSNAPGELQIFNILGGLVMEYKYGIGTSSIIWNATDANNNQVSTGVYFVKATNDKHNITAKLVYLK